MPHPARLALRLRRGLLRSYEVTLYVLLLALGLAVALPPFPGEAAEEEPLQCGNIQSRAVVITR